MKEYEYIVKRTDIGTITVRAENENEARDKVRDEARRIILVDGIPWHTMRIVHENLVGIIKQEGS